jgi:glycosyltransferase involved in cell wall biosynthesis
MSDKNPLVIIGMPVYNGEKYIESRLESIFNQTYENYQIIISDNASTDKTQKICEKKIESKKNISYYRQKKNLGYVSNFNFLINKSNGKYFTFAAIDDLWEPGFLEKNVKILEQNKGIVSSIGEVDYFGSSQKNKPSKYISMLKKKIRKQDVNVLEKHVMSISGEYNKKIDKYLRFNQGSFVHGLFRTSEIKKRIIPGPLAAWDLAFILNILKFGDLHVIDEILYHKYAGGLSSKGIIDSFKRHELPIYDFLIPNFSFFKWSWQNISPKFCLRNIDWFLLLTIYGWYNISKKII